jgi:hypothetical protein
MDEPDVDARQASFGTKGEDERGASYAPEDIGGQTYELLRQGVEDKGECVWSENGNGLAKEYSGRRVVSCLCL